MFLDVVVQRIERNADAFLRTVVQAQRAIEKKRRTRFQVDTAILESHDPNLRSLQVTQQADVPTAVVGGLAQLARTLSMLVCAAMREIEARNIKSGHDHLA